jgi:hypothetical protein
MFMASSFHVRGAQAAAACAAGMKITPCRELEGFLADELAGQRLA